MKKNPTWFAIEGKLEPIAFDGPSHFRFPQEVAKFVIENFSREGDWILDPFLGLGTALRTAQELARFAVGFETDLSRLQFSASLCQPPSQVIHDTCENIGQYSLPAFDLLFTGPPYSTWHEDLRDFHRVFSAFPAVLKQGARVVVQIANYRVGDSIRRLAWDAAKVLDELFVFEGEIVRCNTGGEIPYLGYHHDYLLIYRRR